MHAALAQVCTLPASFEADVADYAAGKCQAVEIWFTKLEDYLAHHTPQEARQLLAEQGVTAPVAAGQGGLLTTQGESRRAAWDLFAQRLALCRELGIGTLVLAGDFGAPLAPTDLERARLSLEQAAQLAGEHELRLALEFQARAPFGNNLQTASALVAQIGSPHLGICLDAFHYHVGPSKPSDLEYLSRENLFHVQLCDLADVPREFAVDADRILPGDGDIDLPEIVRRLREIDYEGHVSLELFNPQIWQVPPRQFGEIGLTALRKALGQASM